MCFALNVVEKLEGEGLVVKDLAVLGSSACRGRQLDVWRNGKCTSYQRDSYLTILVVFGFYDDSLDKRLNKIHNVTLLTDRRSGALPQTKGRKKAG